MRNTQSRATRGAHRADHGAADARSAAPPSPDRPSFRRGPPAGDLIAVGYCRRSTDRQEQSIPDQQRAVERYCKEQGLTLLRWYIDDAISGTSSTNRPGFQKVIADAQSPRRDFSRIVVYDVKRIGRVDNDEAGYYRHILKTHGVEVLYATEGFSGGETDDLLRPVKQWQARQESKDLSKVTIRGLVSKSEKGWWLGGCPPHGYDLRYEDGEGGFLFTVRHMPDGTKTVFDERGKVTRNLARGEALAVSKRDRARLVLGEPGRVQTVRRIFSMYVEERRGLKAIADTLNRDGTPTPRGPSWSHIYAGKWRDGTVRAILLNPIYAGDMVWNRRTDARFHMIVGGRAVERRHPHGARLVPNAEENWIVVKGTHEAMVSRKVYEKAKAVRTERPASKVQTGRAKVRMAVGVVGGWTGARSRFLLSGLVHCAACGNRYQGVTRAKGKARNDGTTVRTFYYACGGYVSKGTSVCSFNPVRQESLERLVVDAVLGFYAQYQGAEGRERLVRAVRAAQGLESRDLAEARRRLDAERRKTESTIARLLDHISPGTRDMAERRLAELRKERARLEARHAELDGLAAGEADVQQTTTDLARFLAGLGFTFEHGLPDERLSAIRRCVGKVVVVKAAGSATLSLRPLPTPCLAGLPEQEVSLQLRAVAERPSPEVARPVR